MTWLLYRADVFSVSQSCTRGRDSALQCAAEAQPELRAYIPNVMFGDLGLSAAEPGAAPPGQEPSNPLPPSTVLGLALVALSDLRDEELLLNYRCERPPSIMQRPAPTSLCFAGLFCNHTHRGARHSGMECRPLSTPG